MTILKVDTISGIGTEGPVFEGDIEFTSQNFLTLPKGDTTQRGRGRGFIGAGSDGSLLTRIDYLEIQSQGNAIDFGDLTLARQGPGACSNGVGYDADRACWGGGGGYSNVIDYVAISTTGNATDFGDLTAARRYTSACSGD